jgi:hypothetical protein
LTGKKIVIRLTQLVISEFAHFSSVVSKHFPMAGERNRPGDPMDLGNMRHLGVQRLAAYCVGAPLSN